MKTSIIILTSNKLEYTQKCIESIRDFTKPGTFEIIVVDNHSTDGTVNWLQEQADITLICNKENLGFPKGCNQGMEAAGGDSVLLLNNDTIVTENWLENLTTCLNSSPDIGAVGAITNNCSNYQTIPVHYASLEEMHRFAADHNVSNPEQWEERLKLVGYCMLITQEVIEKIGLLDERFTPGNYEDDDYSFRIRQAGYRLILSKDTFIHHVGSVSFGENRNNFAELLRVNGEKFEKKWGFNPTYSAYIRLELIDLIDAPKEQPLKVLEIGCACGATLLKIKSIYTRAELYGVELNEHAAEAAKAFANVISTDIEQAQLEFEPQFFDYIILADVLEHLRDPWELLKRLKNYLSPKGAILASIPNVMHYSVLRGLINGNWTYQDAGILDKTHMRFFTLNEINKMFLQAGFGKLEYRATTLNATEDDKNFISEITKITANPSDSTQFFAYQYLVKGAPEISQDIISSLINRIAANQELESAVSQLRAAEIDDVIKVIESRFQDKVELLNTLAVSNFLAQEYNHVLPYLNRAFEIDKGNKDTLYNLGYVLNSLEEPGLAKTYLDMISDKDEQVLKLLDVIKRASSNS